MKAELVPDNGDPAIPIVKDMTIVGRREFCDVVIDDPSLSKRHCVVVKTDGLLVIRDLASTNGTKVKGQRVRWAALLPDDRIAFGAYKMRVYLGPDDTPSPSEFPKGRGASAPPRQTVVAQSPANGEPRRTVAAPPNAPKNGVQPENVWEEDDSDSGDDGSSIWRHHLNAAPALDDDDDIIDLD